MTLPPDPLVPLPATSAGREVLSEARVAQLREVSWSQEAFEALQLIANSHEALRLQLKRVTQEKEEAVQRSLDWSDSALVWMMRYEKAAKTLRDIDDVRAREVLNEIETEWAKTDLRPEPLKEAEARAERAEADLLRVWAECEEALEYLDPAHAESAGAHAILKRVVSHET